ncbi:MAG: DNA polymerase III subunit delta' [Tissierellia bacterium]|nr:DNA polymerase III subunit delta' [Tissierellia bacterium]
MDFTQILGHENIIKNLQNAIENGKVSHSYLFEGEESMGKKMVALSFAKTLLCKEEKLEPCNNCNSCLKFDNFNHPDLKLIEPEKDLIKKEEIDKVIKNINIAPLESNRRIIIINDSDKIGMEGQNTLLKTLEEPPSYINIILITSNSNKIIPTILSRCERIKFYPVESEKIENLLISRYNKTRDEAKFIVHFTKGSVGQAIELSQSQDFFNKRDETLEIIHNIVKGDKYKAFDSYDFFLNNKENYEEILDIMIYWFRDLIIYKELGNTELLLNRDKISLLSSQVFLKENQINDIIKKIINVKQDIQRNVNYQLAIETMLLSMQEV